MITDTRQTALPMFLAGLGAGLAVALLLAPLSGTATRRLMRRKLRHGENWARDAAERVRDGVEYATDKLTPESLQG